MKRRGARLLLSVFPMVIAGCAEGAESRDRLAWRGTIDTVAGVIRVHNPDAGMWTPDRAWRIVEELRIGQAEGEGPEVFGEIAAIGRSPSGAIHVLDGQSQLIRVFDAAGRYERTIGGTGAGPGELRGAYGLSWGPDGRLWVTDPGNGRYVVFDSLGRALHHYPRSVPGVLFPWLGGFGADGFLYDVAPRPAADGSTSFSYFRIDTTGQVVDTFPSLDQAPGPAAMTMGQFVVMPRLTFRFHPSGHLWSANTGEYRLVQRTLEGDTVRIVEREYARLPVTAEERDSIQRELEALPPPLRAEAPEIPAHKPVFERIHLDGEGNVFVQIIGERADQGRIFDVLDREGRYLGEDPLGRPVHHLPGASAVRG